MERGYSPNREQQGEINAPESALDRVKIVEKAREEPEEGFLREREALLFVHIRQYENDDGEDLREVVYLCLFIVNTRSVTVVFDDIYDNSRHGVQSLESMSELPGVDAFDVTVYAGLCADPEEKRRDIFRLEDPLLGQLVDVRNERFLWSGRPLVDVDPLLEPNEQLFS